MLRAEAAGYNTFARQFNNSCVNPHNKAVVEERAREKAQQRAREKALKEHRKTSQGKPRPKRSYRHKIKGRESETSPHHVVYPGKRRPPGNRKINTRPRLRNKIVQEAQLHPIPRQGRANANYTLNGGTAVSRIEADKMGREFVGPNYHNIYKKNKLVGIESADGTRVYRFPKWKAGQQKTQANFQRWATSTKQGMPHANGHLNIK